MLKQLYGGILIGLGVICLLYFTGFISGMNSMWDTIFVLTDDFQYRWKSIWLGTFIILGNILKDNKVESLPLNIYTFISFFILAFGVRMAKGCTSGHGINGLARLSKRSFVAVIIFFITTVLVSSNIKLLSIKKTNSIITNNYLLIVLVVIWIVYAFNKTEEKDENKEINIKNILSIIFSASLFSYGLILSGMYNYSVVKQSMNFNHNNWNYKLFVVFISGVIVSLIGYQIILKYKTQPLNSTCEQSFITENECKFILPKRNKIDTHLVVGSLLFGVGWGLTGMCPSTFPIRIGMGDPSAYLGLGALFLGYNIEYMYENIRKIKIKEDIILHQFFDPPSSSFTYIVGDTKTNEVVIIDSVYNNKNYDIPTRKLFKNIYYVETDIKTSDALLLFCDMMNYKIKYLINTHIHIDHITANNEIKKKRYIPSIIGNYPNTKSDLKFENMDKIHISKNIYLEPIHTPGHTKNCFSLILHKNHKKIVFSGDLLLINGVGRTDLDKKQNKKEIKKNKEILFNSLLKLISRINKFNNNTYIYPAHDYKELKSIQLYNLEKVNPFIKYVNKYIKNKDANIKKQFINYFESKEKELAQFDDYDINLCVDINKMCGVVDNIQNSILDRLWSKSSGACG